MTITEIFENQNYNLTFIENTNVIQALEQYYKEGYTPVYNDLAVMRDKVSLIATLNSDKINKLYETTQYQYDPIQNYDAIEDYTDTTTDKSKNTNDGTTVTSDYPSNTTVDRATQKDTVNGTGTYENTTTFIHHFERSGNIGVTTTQQMIQEERKIILKLQEIYCKLYEDLFYFDVGCCL